MQRDIPYKAIVSGVLASTLLLGMYFLILTLVSGWGFTQEQFFDFWYFIVSLAVGFGIQVGLYVYLQGLISSMHGEGKVLGVTATTSTVSMVSCCAHYLVNVLPILGVAGAVTFVAQYQTELFWVGIVFNLGGIVFITHRINTFKKI